MDNGAAELLFCPGSMTAAHIPRSAGRTKSESNARHQKALSIPTGSSRGQGRAKKQRETPDASGDQATRCHDPMVQIMQLSAVGGSKVRAAMISELEEKECAYRRRSAKYCYEPCFSTSHRNCTCPPAQASPRSRSILRAGA